MRIDTVLTVAVVPREAESGENTADIALCLSLVPIGQEVRGRELAAFDPQLCYLVHNFRWSSACSAHEVIWVAEAVGGAHDRLELEIKEFSKHFCIALPCIANR